VQVRAVPAVLVASVLPQAAERGAYGMGACMVCNGGSRLRVKGKGASRSVVAPACGGGGGPPRLCCHRPPRSGEPSPDAVSCELSSVVSQPRISAISRKISTIPVAIRGNARDVLAIRRRAG